MFIISGEFQVKEERREELIEMSLNLIPLSLSEAGCISYSFLEDCARPGTFLFFERWKSRSDISDHFGKSYFKDFAEKFPDMISGDAIIEIHEVAAIEKV